VAARVLALLEEAALPPSQLIPSVEGGIALSLAGENVRAEIEIYNTGEIAAVTYSEQSEPIAWDIDSRDDAIESGIERIRVHLSA
jgi:hypothetical protein